jgi:hypothetical protein
MPNADPIGNRKSEIGNWDPAGRQVLIKVDSQMRIHEDGGKVACIDVLVSHKNAEDRITGLTR